MSAVSSLPNPPAAYLRFENSADALEPPPPPAPGAQFEVFGHPWNHDDIPGTPAPKRARVAGDDDLPTELKRINRKMRQVVLDFLAAASESKKTADYQPKYEEMCLLFNDMHELISSHRRHQALETLIVERRAEIANIDHATDLLTRSLANAENA